MAYVEPVKGGGFKARWREGGRGSPLLASRVFADEAKARDFADDIGGKVAAKRMLARSKRQGAPIGLAEVFARWGAARVAAKGIGADRIDKRTALLRHMATVMGWQTVADITPAEVDRWRQESGGRNARLGAYLRAALRWSAERLQQPVPEGTWVSLRPPRAPRRARPDLPTSKKLGQWQRRADEQGASTGALIHCLSLYGWRPITAAKLTVGDVDLKRGAITLRDLKGGGDDLHHWILPATMKRLRPLCAGRRSGAPLFIDPRTGRGWLEPDEDGEAAADSPITDWWRVHVEPSGGPGRGVYDLKRHAISTMLARGLPPQDVALFTGHRSLSQVLTYARSNEERGRAALAKLGPAKRQRTLSVIQPTGKKRGSTREHGGRSGGFRRGSASA